MPFIFVSTHTVKEGKLDDVPAATEEFISFVEANEPRVLGMHAYLDEESRKLTLVQIHPDAESMELHLQVAADRIHQAFELVDNDSVDVYGRPGPIAQRVLDQLRGEGVAVAVEAPLAPGFERDAAD